MKYTFLKIVVLNILTSTITFAQQKDTSKAFILKEVQISTQQTEIQIERLPEIQGTLIYAGKKNEVIKVATLNADLSSNNPRQIFGKVPGITIWENDGSGIQTGISSRGLSPNRSWEFNVRQNGYDISSEIFGYPEAYFSPPMEAVNSIEIVRGAASLQYGPQFGGLLNYVIKKGDPIKPFSFESQQTVGSFGLFNSYNAIGGTYKKISYYAYFHHRNCDGWRQNSIYNINTGYLSFNYSVNSKMNVSFQYTRMGYESQQAGGLTDSLFQLDHQQSKRSRNWFSAPWNVASLQMDYTFNESTKLNIKIFSTISQRNSVGYVKAINLNDSINTDINAFNPRQVDRDFYSNLGSEVRFLKTYQVFKLSNTLSTGIRVYKGSTDRKQLGIGTNGTDYNLSISSLSNGKDWGRELTFLTNNVALFAENIIRLNKRLSITPGLRYEMINSTYSGFISATANNDIKNGEQNRNVFLFGSGLSFKTNSTTDIYANFSQAFRPVTFSELTPSSTIEVIDPNLKDASGFNFDFGYRGCFKNYICFDIGGFYLNYDNRIGTISKDNLPFRTNIGTSVSKGIESFVEIDPIRMFTSTSKIGYIHLYVSYAYVNAKYTKWNNPAIVNDPTKSIENKRVENSPENIFRYGLTYSINNFSATMQVNNVSSIYTDAANTELANTTATVGKIPGYQVIDASITYLFSKIYNVKAGVNNIADEKYATRRAGGYPGPGLLPANGRSLFLSAGVKF